MHPGTFPDLLSRTSKPPQVIAVIPARYASTRLPGKPLADIGGRPMIEHVYRRAAAARGVDAVIVATDDERIARAVEAFGGLVAMTDPEHRTGTDRVAQIARSVNCSIVVNVQGDLPFIEPRMIEQLVEPLLTDPGLVMSTVGVPLENPDQHQNPNVVKVVRDRDGNAMYFSRAPIPHFRDSGPPNGGRHVYKHLGLYGYRRDFLLTFANLPQTPLEKAESLEQLRALEHGCRIRVVESRYESIEVDTPEDLERARRMPLATAQTRNEVA